MNIERNEVTNDLVIVFVSTSATVRAHLTKLLHTSVRY